MKNRNRASTVSKKKQNYGGAIQQRIVYWDTTNLMEEYAPNKIVIRIVIFAEFGTVQLLSANIGQCQIQNIHFPRCLKGGGNVL